MAKVSSASMEYPPVTSLLGKRVNTSVNVIIGTDPLQIGFAEAYFHLIARKVDTLTDDLCTVKGHVLYQIDGNSRIDVSPQTEGRISLWSTPALVKGSGGLNAIIRYAFNITGEAKPDKLIVERVGSAIIKDSIVTDIRATLWQTVDYIIGTTLTTDPEPTWEGPWKSSQSWIPPGVDLDYRMHSLFKDIAGYILVKSGDENYYRQFNLKPSRIQKLKQLNLNPYKVEQTLKALSQWKNKKIKAIVAALMITAIWMRG